jgi:hypothetical protein
VSTTVSTNGNVDTWVITNNSQSVVDTHLLAIVTNLPSGVTVDTTTTTGAPALPGGRASGEPVGEPYYRIFLPTNLNQPDPGMVGVLAPGQATSLAVTRTGGGSSSSYRLKFLSGQGSP